MFTLYGLSLIIMIAGIGLGFWGLKVYKIAQMLFCAFLGSCLGLTLVNIFSRQEFYILALLLTLLGGFLGYKHYKFSLYLGVFLGTFAVVFSYFWRQAVEIAGDTVGDIIVAKNVLANNLTDMNSLQNVLDSFDVIRAIYNSNFQLVLHTATEIIKHGIVISVAVALVAGVLSIWIGDYVIIFVTAGAGSLLLVSLVEMYIYLPSMTHLLLLVVVGIVGMIVQYRNRKRRR